MSVDIRTSLHCLRHPSRFMPVSRSQLSEVHTGDSIQDICKLTMTLDYFLHHVFWLIPMLRRARNGEVT